MLSPTRLARLAGTAEIATGSEQWPPARGVTFSTERLRQGDIFFALPGQNRHGSEFADQALRLGASFIVSDRPHPRGLQTDDPAGLLLKLGRDARTRLQGRVIGVTGSAGKTTMKDLLAGILATRATPGNLNTLGALACTLVETAIDAPTEDLILELGIDRPGEMAELLELTRPDVGVLTVIAPSHSEFLGSVTDIAAQKRLLLDSAATRFASTQALPFLQPLPDGLISYGTGEHATVRGRVSEGSEVTIAGHAYPLRQPGSAWASNVTGAVAVALQLGVPAAAIHDRLARAVITPGRLQLRRSGNRTIIDDSYNSNPASAAAALEVLAASAGPRSAILGDMRELGHESSRHHLELGRATRQLDLVIAVGANAADVRAGNPDVITAPDTDSALELLHMLPEGGTVLVKASRSLGFERIVKTLEASQ